MSFNLTNLPESWNLVRLDSLCKGDSISYGVVQPGRNIQGGVPIIRVNNFRNNRIDCSDLLRVEPSIAAKYQRTMLEGGEVLITIVGSVGQVAFTNETHRGFNVARAVAVIKPKHTVNSQWIAYCLESPIARQWLLNGANTTVQTTINLKDLRSLQIPVPPSQYVSRVVALLSSIDAKVETIAKQNEVLESIAQTLFKSWFVNFDPVHAKAAGRDPEGLSAEIAALFPSEFEESELGLIPKGWGISTFGDAFDVKGGGTPSTGSPEFWENGTYLWATPKDMSGLTCAVIHETERRITDAGVNKISSKQLPINTVLMSSRAPVGYLAIAKAAISINQGFIAIPPVEDFPPSLVYCLLKNSMEEIKGNAGGSTFAEISKSAFKPIKFVNADANVRRKFGEVCEPLIDLIHVNSLLISNLAATRDELLPRLISGKIRIEEAEEALADVVPSTDKQVA